MVHRVENVATRGWNVPLGIGLFGTAVLVGGAILAYPQLKSAPSHVDVGDPHGKPFPSFPEEIPALQRPAPAATGGGPSGPVRDASVADVSSVLVDATQTAVSDAAPAAPAATEAPTEGTAAAPAAAPVAAAPQPTGQPDATVRAAADATSRDAVSTEVSDAASWSSDDAYTISDTLDNVPYVYPTYGAPPPLAGVTGHAPVVSGGYGDGGTVWSSGGTSGTSGNTGVVDPKPSITAPLLVPMADGARPETVWPTISPFLRGGDFVVAQAGGDPSTFLGFAERVRTDSPLVTYVVAFYSPASLQSSLGKLPAALSAAGLSSTAGLNEATLTAASSAVRATGRKMFLSVNVPSPLPLATIGARVDVVELIVPGGSADEVAKNAKTAANELASHAQIFVRLPSFNGATGAVAASTTISSAMPGAGVAMPWSPNLGTLLADYRGTSR